jgi:TatD DNase family protein
MELIDTHCHLDIDMFSTDLDSLLVRARAAGVNKMVLPGVNRVGWDRLIDVCKNSDGLFAAPGLHPMYLPDHHPNHLAELKQLVVKNRVVAIGEIGLDYYIEKVDRFAQQHLFEQQLIIAASAHLPVLLHVRKAHDQVLAILRSKRFPYGGIVHAFSGSFQQASHYIKLGFGISLCGSLTYDRAKRIRAIATQLPQHAIVLETDAPDIPLSTHRGSINLPEYLPEILEVLAQLRGEPPAFTADYTTANAQRLLGLTN